jgi:very-short-patch-repair endonuclease
MKILRNDSPPLEGGGRGGGKWLAAKAKELRGNATEAEKYLWYMLRLKNLGFKFRRQAVIGSYIVDFICFEKGLIVEVDGGQHGDSMKDKERDEWLRQRGYSVLRFWNNDVLGNRKGVIEKISEYLNHPLPIPPLKGEGIVKRIPLRKKNSLKNLLAKVNQSNIHHEKDFGTNQGLGSS